MPRPQQIEISQLRGSSQADQFSPNLVVRNRGDDHLGSGRFVRQQPGVRAIHERRTRTAASEAQRASVEQDDPGHCSDHPFEELATWWAVFVDASHEARQRVGRVLVRKVAQRGHRTHGSLSTRASLLGREGNESTVLIDGAREKSRNRPNRVRQ
jgi:hypothetical protein